MLKRKFESEKKVPSSMHLEPLLGSLDTNIPSHIHYSKLGDVLFDPDAYL